MCPRGVDQTTRSPPRWTLLAPEIQQQEALGGNKGRTSGIFEFLREEGRWDAFGKLARVGHPAAARLPAILAKPIRGAASSPLEMLAAELVDMIVAGLDVEDQVALALCSTMLWCHVLDQVHGAYRADAPWAGTPIICTSTWLTDLPKSLDGPMKAWEASVAGSQRVRNRTPARSWNWGALSTFHKLKNLPSLEARYLTAFDKHAAMSAIPERVQGLLKPGLEKVISSRNDWRLRNLNTREVVHFEVTQVERSQAHTCDVHTSVKGCSWLTLDIALTLRICWGESGAFYRAPETRDLAIRGLERGVLWADNCFDVVAAESHVEGDGWRDATEEIVAEANLVKREFSLAREKEARQIFYGKLFRLK